MLGAERRIREQLRIRGQETVLKFWEGVERAQTEGDICDDGHCKIHSGKESWNVHHW